MEKEIIKRYPNGTSELEGIKNNLDYVKVLVGFIATDMSNGYNSYGTLNEVVGIYKRLETICDNFSETTEIKN